MRTRKAWSRPFLRVLPGQGIVRFCFHMAEVTGSNPVAPTSETPVNKGDSQVLDRLPLRPSERRGRRAMTDCPVGSGAALTMKRVLGRTIYVVRTDEAISDGVLLIDRAEVRLWSRRSSSRVVPPQGFETTTRERRNPRTTRTRGGQGVSRSFKSGTALGGFVESDSVA